MNSAFIVTYIHKYIKIYVNTLSVCLKIFPLEADVKNIRKFIIILKGNKPFPPPLALEQTLLQDLLLVESREECTSQTSS